MNIDMYLNEKVARKFAENEEKDLDFHTVVSEIIDNYVSFKIKERFHIVNLGAGANPKKYPKILKKILEEDVSMDWVDLSPTMVKLAQEKLDSELLNKIIFSENDFIGYMAEQESESLDCVIMQFCFNYINDLQIFMGLLAKRLNSGGFLIANLGAKELMNNDEASFLINNKEIKEPTLLNRGDKYTINFLDEEKNIYASTEKKFYSYEEIGELSSLFGFRISIEKTEVGEIMILLKK